MLVIIFHSIENQYNNTHIIINNNSQIIRNQCEHLFLKVGNDYDNFLNCGNLLIVAGCVESPTSWPIGNNHKKVVTTRHNTTASRLLQYDAFNQRRYVDTGTVVLLSLWATSYNNKTALVYCPHFCSAFSGVFAKTRTVNFNAIIRKRTFSLMRRVCDSFISHIFRFNLGAHSLRCVEALELYSHGFQRLGM